MIEVILPPEVAAEEAFGDLPDVALFPEEEAVIARAVDKRRNEFTTARGCARVALARLGLPPVPIVPGLRGAPQWPSNVVGSITHCAGYRACAVARDRDVVTIGLDAEPHDVLPDGVLGAVASAQEQARLAALTRDGVTASLKPIHALEVNAYIVRQPAAGIDRGGLSPFRDANSLSDQILRAFHRAIGSNIKRREPKQPR